MAIRSPVLCPLGGSPGGIPRKVSPVTISVFFLRGSLRRAAFFAAKESGERNRQRGPISRRSPLESLPDDEGGSAPFEPQRGTGDGRTRTGERGRGLRIATTSDIGHWFRNDGYLLFGASSISWSESGRYHVAHLLSGASSAGRNLFIFAVPNQSEQSLMICTQMHRYLSLRDPVRGRGNPYSRPLVHAGRNRTGVTIYTAPGHTNLYNR